MSGGTRKVYAFGPFRLDPRERLLSRGSEPLPLTPKAFDVLLTLVQRHGHLVDKSDLLDQVWPATAVEESNLSQNVFILRRVLGSDGARNGCIETVPKRGYRFVAPVQELEVAEHSATAPVPPTPNAGRPYALPFSLAVVTLIGVVAVSVWLMGASVRTRSESGDPGRISLERLTTTGRATMAAVSPDGRYVAYVLDEGRNRSLWTRDVRTGSQLQVRAADAVDYWGLAFDPKSAYIFATVWEWDKKDASIVRIPVLGGDADYVLESSGSALSFSPDGRLFAQIETSDARGESRITIYRLDGTVERTAAVSRDPDRFKSSYNSTPVWSHDGRAIAAVAIAPAEKGVRNTIVAVDVHTGAERRLTRKDWATIGPIVWLRDGRMIFVGREEPTSPQQIWELSAAGNVARPLTTDAMDYDAVSATEDGSLVIAVRTERSIVISTGAADGAREYRQINAEVGVPKQATVFSWSLDGRIVYASTTAGPLDLWIANADGSGRRRVTADAARDFHPAVSPDGKSIVYASDREGTINLWRVGLDGRGATRVTDGTGTGDVYPRWFPDGHALVFQRGYVWGETIRLAKLRLDGATPQLFTTRTSLRPVVAPDGRHLAYFRMEPGGWRLVVAVSESGREVATFTPPRSSRSRALQWTPDGTALAYIDAPDGVDNIWIQRLRGGPATRLTRFESGAPIEFFDWSPDGTRLAITREVLTSDLVRVIGLN